MNENVRFVVLIAVVVAAVGGAWYFLYGGKSDDAPEPPIIASNTEPDVPVAEPQPEEPRRVLRPDRPFQVSSDRTSPTSSGSSTRRTGVSTIKGTVKLADNEAPLSGVSIHILMTAQPPERQPVKDGPEWDSTSTGDGSFEIKRLPYGDFAIIATTDGLLGVSGASTTDDEPISYVDIEMRPAGAIAGTVVNESGEPIAGARVFPEKTSDDRNHMGGSTGLAARVITNDDGTFLLPHLWEGDWQLTAQADGYAMLMSDYIPLGTTDAELVLTVGGSVAGEVVAAETGEPIEGITVNAAGEQHRAENEAKTDSEGRFEIAHLADGKYTATVDDDTRLIAGKAPEFTIAGGDRAEGLRLIVATGGIVTGHALDADTGEPIDAVRFQARPDNRTTPTRTAESGADGFFKLEGLGEGPHTIRRRWKIGYLHGEDREDQKVNVQLGKTVEGIDFRVKKGLYVRGNVLDEEGKPVEGVQVHSQPVNYNGEGESTVTREDGTFEHRGFSPNQKIQITASGRGFSAPPVGPLDLGDADLNGIEIRMATGGSIAGVVVDKTGQPMTRASISAIPVQGGQNSQSQGSGLDRDGKFKIQGLLAGAYRLEVHPYDSYSRSSGSQQQGTEVTLAEGEKVTGVRVVYEEVDGLTIAGRVTNGAGEPLHNASISANMDRGGSYGHANTDENGNYTIKGLQEGSYRVFAFHNEYSREEQPSVQAGTTNVNFVLAGRGTIEGRVISASSGQPVTKFQIGAFPGQINLSSPGMYGNLTAFVDPQGNFRLTNVEVGDNYVAVLAEGFAPSQQSIPGVREGSTVSGVLFKLEPGATIEGLVIDRSGQPVANARIYLGDAPNDQWRIDRETVATSDAGGRFEIASLGPDVSVVSAAHSDYAPGSAPVSVAPGGTAQVTIKLGGGGTIEGRVTIAGKPAVGQSVHIQRQDGGGRPSSAQTDNNGMYSIKGIAEGEVMVMANVRQGESSRNAHQQAIVAEDQVTIVDFDFAGGNATVEGYVTIDGQPVTQGHVSAAVTGSVESFNGQVDGNGYYRLEGMLAGSVTLRVSYQASENDWQTRAAQINALDGRVTRHDFEVTAGATITGAVSGGNADGRVFVVIVRGNMQITTIDQGFWQANQHLIAGNAMVQPDGTFRAGGMEAGDYTVLAVGMPSEPSPDMTNARIATQFVRVAGEGEVAVNLTLP
jgi:uncharacterized GH25 family protein